MNNWVAANLDKAGGGWPLTSADRETFSSSSLARLFCFVGRRQARRRVGVGHSRGFGGVSESSRLFDRKFNNQPRPANYLCRGN